MFTRMTPEKRTDPYRGERSSNIQPHSSTENKRKKLHVRSMDYLMIMQLILNNPDAILPDEFMLLQRHLGTNEALLFIKKAKEQKQLEKAGASGENKKITLARFNQNLIQQFNQMKSQNVNLKSEQVVNTQRNQEEVSPTKSSLPQALKNSLENLSGVNLSDVEVHRNSDKPQQLGAKAYTQGKDIYIAPGQEEHLPHEGWHAVQQKQGRVQPTLQLKSDLAVNQDRKLEEEADIMGSKAENESKKEEMQIEEKSRVVSNVINNNIIQMAADKKVQKKRKVRLWEPNSGAVAEVDADNTQTIELLKSNGYKETSEGNKNNWVLKVGDNNNKSDVTVLQKVLIKSGYLEMPKDPATQQPVPFGTYGDLTKQAVKKFQSKKGLKVDGIVGPATWKAMLLPWSKETNEPHREHHQYQIILNNKNIYSNGSKTDNKKVKSSGNESKTSSSIHIDLNLSGSFELPDDFPGVTTTGGSAIELKGVHYVGDAGKSKVPPSIARRIISVGVGFIPFVGDIKDVQEVLTGYDIITGEELTWKDRGITLICFFVPVVNGRAVREALGLVDEGFDLAKTAMKNSDDAVIGAKKVKSKDSVKTKNPDKGTSNTQLTFDEALKKLDKSGLRPGQTEISKSRVMEIVENYDPMKAQSSVYTDSTGRYLVEGHHTTVANTMLGKGSGVNMNIPTQQMPSATNVYWTKKWYEFWKTQIKVTK